MTRKPERVRGPFQLEDHYGSETAKRKLGKLCQTINERGEKVGLSGTPDNPLLYLEDADAVEATSEEIELSIEEARADWSAVIAAATYYGTRFRIHGKRVPRVVLYRHPTNEGPAEKYRRAKSRDVEAIAETLEDLVRQVRRLERSVSARSGAPVTQLVERLEAAANLIDRRFRELWRVSEGLPPHLDCSVQPRHLRAA